MLNIEDEVFREAVDRNAPTRILRSLKELTSRQKEVANFTESRKNIEVKAFQIPHTNVNGIGFAYIARNTMSVGYTQIFDDPEDIPISDTDTAIMLPSEAITRFRSRGKMKRLLISMIRDYHFFYYGGKGHENAGVKSSYKGLTKIIDEILKFFSESFNE